METDGDRDMNPLLLALQRRDKLSAAERAIIDEMTTSRKRFAAKSDIVVIGDRPSESCLILSGYSARYNLLGSGRRRITAIHVPGDFVDLHSFLLSEMDHSVLALTECEAAMVPHERLREISASEPHLTRMLWLLTAVDAAVYRQWLTSSGRLSSAGQIAHFLCEMFTRLDILGMTRDFAYRLPLSQAELGDAMGLSVVHVNRTLQMLRRDGLIEWQGDAVRILDWARLQRAAEFDPTYLDLNLKPR